MRTEFQRFSTKHSADVTSQLFNIFLLHFFSSSTFLPTYCLPPPNSSDRQATPLHLRDGKLRDREHSPFVRVARTYTDTHAVTLERRCCVTDCHFGLGIIFRGEL